MFQVSENCNTVIITGGMDEIVNNYTILHLEINLQYFFSPFSFSLHFFFVPKILFRSVLILFSGKSFIKFDYVFTLLVAVKMFFFLYCLNIYTRLYSLVPVKGIPFFCKLNIIFMFLSELVKRNGKSSFNIYC